MVKKHNKKNSRISPSVTAAIGAVITLIGGFFLFYNYVQSQKIVAFDYIASAFYDGNEIVNISEHEDKKEQVVAQELSGEVTNEYICYLSIPKINLTKPLKNLGTFFTTTVIFFTPFPKFSMKAMQYQLLLNRFLL